MCFSPEASFAAAAILMPTGGATVARAYRTDRRYLAIAALPFLFGLQQAFEGGVWTTSESGNISLVGWFSLAYMFFSWLAWPVWVPVSVYFLEPRRRKPLYLAFGVLGGMMGAMQYFPYFAHQGWLVVQVLPHAIRYVSTELLGYIIGRDATYVLYIMIIISPLFVSSNASMRVFGGLVFVVLVVTYLFFSYAYISVFCFGGAVMSLYLVWVIFRISPSRPAPHCEPLERSAATLRS